MDKARQTIAEAKREIQVTEWQQQIQARREQGKTVDEWCASKGISKGTYYHRLKRVREYLCQQRRITGNDEERNPSQPAAIVPVHVGQPREKAVMEIQFGDLQIKFNGSPNSEQLKIVLESLMSRNPSAC